MFRLLRSRCQHVARVLQSYLDGEVDSTTEAMVVEHLDVCHSCGLDARIYQAIKAAIATTAPAPEVVDGHALERLRRFADTLSDQEDRTR